MILNEGEKNAIRQLEESGLVNARRDYDNGLTIYCYTPKAEFKDAWDEYMLTNCRGLVVDDNDRVIIPCIPKFFNREQPRAAFKDLNSDNQTFTVKEDGYLIQIVNDAEYGLVVTSKGSFNSQYAEFVRTLITPHKDEFATGLVYICELCKDFAGDENIIVTKHEQPRLVCFAVKEQDTGKELDLLEIPNLPSPLEPVRKMSLAQAEEYVLQDGIEGFVVATKDEPVRRVKCKSSWFLAMHKLISQCTRKKAFEIFENHYELCEMGIPDEFMPQMQGWVNEFTEEYMNIQQEADVCFNKYKDLSDKEFASLVGSTVSNLLGACVFAMRKGKSTDELICRFIKQNVV